jgi:hypothetical protein
MPGGRLPAGWLDRQQFVERVGKMVDPEWTGTERLALPPTYPLTELAKIGDDEAREAWEREIRSGIDQALASNPDLTGLPEPFSAAATSENAEAGREVLLVQLEAAYERDERPSGIGGIGHTSWFATKCLRGRFALRPSILAGIGMTRSWDSGSSIIPDLAIPGASSYRASRCPYG